LVVHEFGFFVLLALLLVAHVLHLPLRILLEFLQVLLAQRVQEGRSSQKQRQKNDAEGHVHDGFRVVGLWEVGVQGEGFLGRPIELGVDLVEGAAAPGYQTPLVEGLLQGVPDLVALAHAGAIAQRLLLAQYQT